MADAPTAAPAATLTLDEATAWLDPPISKHQLQALIHAAGVKPVGSRRKPRGRPLNTYDAAELMRLHKAVMEWLLRGTCILVISLM